MSNQKDGSGQRDRSPGFPAIPLRTALERLKEFETHFRRSPASLNKIGRAWGINAKGYASRISAALRYFGLLDYRQAEDGREMVISADGRQYIRAQQEAVKMQVIQRVALKPKQIAKFWGKWGAERPADEACSDDLVLNNGFSERGAKQFIKVFDGTISFAKLTESDKIIEDNDKNAANDDGYSNGIEQEKIEQDQGVKQDFQKNDRIGTDMKEDVYNFSDNSQLVIRYPASLSTDSFAELDEYVKLFLSKMKRLAKAAKNEQHEDAAKGQEVAGIT